MGNDQSYFGKNLMSNCVIRITTKKYIQKFQFFFELFLMINLTYISFNGEKRNCQIIKRSVSFTMIA